MSRAPADRSTDSQLTLAALSLVAALAERTHKRELKKALKLAKESFEHNLNSWHRRLRLDQPFRWGPEVRRDANGRVASPTASEIAGGCALDDTAEMMRADEEEGDDDEGEGESDEEEEDEAPMDAWFRRLRLSGGGSGGAGGGGGTCGM